jgi:Zn-dependent protease with chaperone function
MAVWQWERGLVENVRDEAAAMLVGTRTPVQEHDRATRDILERVCQTVGHPTPALRIAETDNPLCYTVRYPIESPPSDYLADESNRPAFPDIDRDWSGGDEKPIPEQYVVVVSTGLLSVLSAAELRAVLAHEVAHLRNGDLWLMHWLLLPAHWGASLRDASLLWLPLTSVIRYVPLAGIIPFARGREVAADAGAAAITGAPSTLATALERLDEAVERPETDLRTVAVMNVLPTTSVDNRLGTALSHPGTESRIARLRAMDPDRPE